MLMYQTLWTGFSLPEMWFFQTFSGSPLTFFKSLLKLLWPTITTFPLPSIPLLPYFVLLLPYNLLNGLPGFTVFPWEHSLGLLFTGILKPRRHLVNIRCSVVFAEWMDEWMDVLTHLKSSLLLSLVPLIWHLPHIVDFSVSPIIHLTRLCVPVPSKRPAQN